MIGQLTASEARLREQTVEIYDALVRCGFPGLVSRRMAREEGEMGEALSQYFQPTPMRQGLIEWLIVQLYPLYQPEAPKSEKKSGKSKRMLACLWRLGVMPYSKHTKNLDYEKYLQGLIGQENAITLVHNLCTLLLESKRAIKSRQDNQFHYFLEDIYRNYDSLINVDYDPYKVSFPAAFNDLSEEDFQEKYATFLQKITKLKMNDNKSEQASAIEGKFQRIFKQFESNKSQFLRAYQTLAEKMKKTIEEHQILILTWKKDISEQYIGRTVSVSSELPSLYRKYKEKLKLRSLTPSEVTAESSEVNLLIAALNSAVEL